jgi:hypothetical protein
MLTTQGGERTVILYTAESGDDDRAIYVPVEPADPFTEALRTAEEIGAEVMLDNAVLKDITARKW